MVTTMVHVTPDSTRGDLETCMAHLNAEAKRCLRYDRQGRPNQRWTDLHANLNAILTSWETAPE